MRALRREATFANGWAADLDWCSPEKRFGQGRWPWFFHPAAFHQNLDPSVRHADFPDVAADGFPECFSRRPRASCAFLTAQVSVSPVHCIAVPTARAGCRYARSHPTPVAIWPDAPAAPAAGSGTAGNILYLLQSLLHPGQAFRIQFDVLGVIPQCSDRLIYMNGGAFQHLTAVCQFRFQLEHPVQFSTGADQLGASRTLPLRPADRRMRAHWIPADPRFAQPALFPVDLFNFTGAERKVCSSSSIWKREQFEPCSSFSGGFMPSLAVTA